MAEAFRMLQPPPLVPVRSQITSRGEIVAVYRFASGGLLYVPLFQRWRPAPTDVRPDVRGG
jgi:hypothetical protein